MIEDIEMRELFRIESSEHLQRLDDDLLILENDPGNKEAADEVFREAHSLKGAARMLGLTEIEALAHRFEEIFAQVKNQNTRLLPPHIDQLYHCLEAIRMLVEEALTGVRCDVKVTDLLCRLEPEALGQPQVRPPQLKPTDTTVPPPPPESPVSLDESELIVMQAQANREQQRETGDSAETAAPFDFPSAQANIVPFQIDNIRVATSKLDLLISQIRELTAIKQRIVQRHLDLEDGFDKWHKLAGEIRKNASPTAKAQEKIESFTALLEKLKSRLYDDRSKLEFTTSELEESVRVTRLLPLSSLFRVFPRMVKELAREQSKEARLVVEGGDTTADKRVIEELKDPLMHLMRNALDHGLEPPEERMQLGKPPVGTITLRAYRSGSQLVVEVQDDGRGLDVEAIRRAAAKRKIHPPEVLATMTPEQLRSLIFESTLSTAPFVSDISGRGIGLEVVRVNVQRLKGEVEVESVPQQGCMVRLRLPETLAATKVLTLRASGLTYAIPAESILKTFPVHRSEIFTMEGRSSILFEGEAVSVARLGGLMHFARNDFSVPKQAQIDAPGEENVLLPAIACAVGEERFALIVDELLMDQEVLLKQQNPLLQQAGNILGATLLETGEICLIVSPSELLNSLCHQTIVPKKAQAEEAPKPKTILMAEDSLITRTQMKRILKGAGYQVITAVDGLDALDKLKAQPVDALVSDVQMPNIDGLTLTARVRQLKKYRELPIILVTSLASEEDRRKGADVGANAYLTKPTFDQKVLLDTLRRLV
ncbi:two-component system, chemotaxis family, sensor kinase CheA [Desulfuromusa kysingii]|uniref:histidine kinase n=1 Tax=Desulfuromusa kysingii TaxID=37625 RepID=A0A1H3W150_9BACT|nr:hybrid sensor histidine kinase/response regulator [Desulfuromusa kysingii]SDZ80144.1 two-component system, chemotaxis family, sensor kinase CheA [Desulfuromusa kysingii]